MQPGRLKNTAVAFSTASARALISAAVSARPSPAAMTFTFAVLGAGGYVQAPPAFMRGLRAFCDAHGALLVADEVQSGFGRTGTMLSLIHI